MVAVPQGHSPLGASGAPRWMACPGSVGLSYGLVDEESDHAALGTAAHAVAAMGLQTGYAAWQYTNAVVVKHEEVFNDADLHIVTVDSMDDKKLAEDIRKRGILVDKPMADAVQTYIDFVREAFPDRHQGNTFIERRFHCPTIHKYFYGTTDFAHLQLALRHLHVADYKHGAGIVVEVEENEQCMYYACGMLEDLDLWDKVDNVTLYIVQPRGFHFDGPIRQWTISVPDLQAWLEDKLIPAMNKALVSRDTVSGEHCRFCPARSYACPQIIKDMSEMEKMMTELDVANRAGELTNEQIARFLDLMDVGKIAAKAASSTAFARLQAGKPIPGRKLAKARSNREFKAGAEAEAKKLFGLDAYTAVELKSPAQIEELPKGKAFVTQWAFKPDAGLTVVKDTDARPAVSKDTKSMFTAATKARKGKAA